MCREKCVPKKLVPILSAQTRDRFSCPSLGNIRILLFGPITSHVCISNLLLLLFWLGGSRGSLAGRRSLFGTRLLLLGLWNPNASLLQHEAKLFHNPFRHVGMSSVQLFPSLDVTTGHLLCRLCPFLLRELIALLVCPASMLLGLAACPVYVATWRQATHLQQRLHCRFGA